MKKLLPIALLLLLLFGNCNKSSAPDCFKSNGNESREIRNLAKFNSIELNNNVHAYIYQGNEFKVEVVGPKNLLAKVQTNVNDTMLQIFNKNECAFVRGYKRKIQVFITLPKLKYAKNNSVASMEISPLYTGDTISLRNENSGDIILNGNYNQVYVSSHGNGDVRMYGKANQLLIYTNGLNYIYAQQMEVKDYVYVASLSLGDVYINGTQLKELDCHIHRSGNIYYTGNPLVFNNTFEDFGTGKIIKIN
jgi:Putative auto-transporter adhesin, head GIN domain